MLFLGWNEAMALLWNPFLLVVVRGGRPGDRGGRELDASWDEILSQGREWGGCSSGPDKVKMSLTEKQWIL